MLPGETMVQQALGHAGYKRQFRAMRIRPNRLRIAVALLLWLGVAAAAPVPAQENDNCLICHAEPDLTSERDGREISVWVDLKRLRALSSGPRRRRIARPRRTRARRLFDLREDERSAALRAVPSRGLAGLAHARNSPVQQSRKLLRVDLPGGVVRGFKTFGFIALGIGLLLIAGILCAMLVSYL